MRTITTKVYMINEHPNPSKCYDWIRNNWHDLNQMSVDDMCGSIRALSDLIGGTFDYSISQVPDIGEFISFRDYDKKALQDIIDESDVSGVWCDYEIVRALRKGNPSDALKSLHEDTEYIYSDKGLKELCEDNEYEFNTEGKFINH